MGIIGYTGSGKSTLVQLILRLYEVKQGQLLIDDNEIHRIPLAVLRKHIGYVPQETFLFSESLRENIAYGVDEHSPETIEQAARISQLYKDVIEFPQKFDTMLGERGITLSGGQKQRTRIARAILRNPRILILDDAFSAVDTETESQILTELRASKGQRTCILISHRVSTVQSADKIIVMDQGKIVEEGTHEQLVRQEGIYARLYEKQLLEAELARM